MVDEVVKVASYEVTLVTFVSKRVEVTRTVRADSPGAAVDGVLGEWLKGNNWDDYHVEKSTVHEVV